LKHQRKVEFRRLCETLRLHLANVAKYSHQTHAINLSDSETLQHHLDTRFAQLNTSVELELWQEAFRSVEDVHNLLTMAKKAPRPAMMANYYEKLTKIFLMSGNALYHAAAWGRYYSVVSNMGGRSDDELARLAGQVLVSALAVPVGLNVEETFEEGKGKAGRLAALLGLTKTPTRAGLLKDALSRDVLRLSPPTVKSLYNVLEVTFDPLTLCASTTPLLSELSADTSYASYRPLLTRALLSRLLSQLSQVYSSIKISNLLELVAPLRQVVEADGVNAGVGLDDAQIEAFIMGCARRGELLVRVDHAAGIIVFVDDAYSTEEPPSSSRASSSHEILIQPSISDLVRTRLSRLATCLHNSLAVIDPVPAALSQEQQAEKLGELIKVAEKERKALAVRRALVAQRREMLVELSAQREKEEATRKAEVSKREKDEEARRAREEFRRKELERVQKLNEDIRTEETKRLAEQLIAKGTLKAPIDVSLMQSRPDSQFHGIITFYRKLNIWTRLLSSRSKSSKSRRRRINSRSASALSRSASIIPSGHIAKKSDHSLLTITRSSSGTIRPRLRRSRRPVSRAPAWNMSRTWRPRNASRA
jgi:translation initiation factor 3 subunit A